MPKDAPTCVSCGTRAASMRATISRGDVVKTNDICRPCQDGYRASFGDDVKFSRLR